VPDLDINIRKLTEYGAVLGGALYGFWYAYRKNIWGKIMGFFKPQSFPRRCTVRPRQPEGVARDIRIHNMLVELRTETRADRVQVFQFHNGDYYDNARSIRRFSCSFEILKDGVSSTFEQFQGCLMSGYIDGLRIFLESERPVAKLHYSDLDNGLYKSGMIESGVHCQMGIVLKGVVKGTQRITGLLIITYNEERSASKCAFNALVDEGFQVMIASNTLMPRRCDGTCNDCRYNRYVPRLESELAKAE